MNRPTLEFLCKSPCRHFEYIPDELVEEFTNDTFSGELLLVNNTGLVETCKQLPQRLEASTEMFEFVCEFNKKDASTMEKFALGLNRLRKDHYTKLHEDLVELRSQRSCRTLKTFASSYLKNGGVSNELQLRNTLKNLPDAEVENYIVGKLAVITILSKKITKTRDDISILTRKKEIISEAHEEARKCSLLKNLVQFLEKKKQNVEQEIQTYHEDVEEQIKKTDQLMRKLRRIQWFQFNKSRM